MTQAQAANGLAAALAHLPPNATVTSLSLTQAVHPQTASTSQPTDTPACKRYLTVTRYTSSSTPLLLTIPLHAKGSAADESEGSVQHEASSQQQQQQQQASL